MSRVSFEIACFWKCLSEIAAMHQLASPCPSVYLSARSISKNDGRGFVKFGPGELYKNSWHIQFRLQSNEITDIHLNSWKFFESTSRELCLLRRLHIGTQIILTSSHVRIKSRATLAISEIREGFLWYVVSYLENRFADIHQISNEKYEMKSKIKSTKKELFYNAYYFLTF